MMSFKTYIYLLLILAFYNSYSQTVVSGIVKNENNEPLNGATIIVSEKANSAILSYAISDSKGGFETETNTLSDSLIVKISYLGYTSWQTKINNKNQQLTVQLFPSTENLKEVLIEAKIIEQRGDTISYSVESFKDSNDRVISDVISKMPGIEIMPSGQIYYQGAPIQKYYIEGLDLLEGRYNLANENISADDVSKVQILENHQPIQVLDSLEFSERASLNIKLKKNQTFTGNAKLGLGFSPLLRDVRVTPLLFSKKNQILVTLQSNNTGNSISREIKNFSNENSNLNYSTSWLTIPHLSTPPFESEIWLNNNTHLGSINVLQRIKKEFDLKLNVSYLNDSQYQVGSVNTFYYTPSDTIKTFEKKQNDLYIRNFQSQLILEKNTKSYYIKNNFEFKKNWNNEYGIVGVDSSGINQKLDNPFSSIRNNFELIKTIGNQLVNFKSVVGQTSTNQELEVEPGQFLDLHNNIQSGFKLNQLLESTVLYTDNSAGITKSLNKITYTSKLGFFIKREKLDSDLLIDENEDVLGQNFKNELELNTSQVYFNNVFNFRSTNNVWKMRLKAPISLLNVKKEDKNSKGELEISRVVFEPNFYVKKKLSARWDSNVFAGYNYKYGNIHKLYNGFIMTNYRNLNRYDSPIPEQGVYSFGCSVSYRDPINQFFINGSYNFKRKKSNLLYSNRVDDNGTLIIQAVEYDNIANQNSFYLGISKYFKKINSTFNFNTRFSKYNQENIINSELTVIENKDVSFNFKLDTEIFSWLSSQFSATYSEYRVYFENEKYQPIETNKYMLDLFFYISPVQYLKCNSEYYSNSLSSGKSSSYFLNLTYQYTFKKAKIDLNVSWNNIFNTKEYLNVSVNEFRYVESSYKLRPSQVVASVRFSF